MGSLRKCSLFFSALVSLFTASAAFAGEADIVLPDLNSISFDITLKRVINRITVQVKDINNNQIQSQSPVIIDVH